MSSRPSEYERIRRSSLWAGRDHLLHVRSRWFAEEYQRFSWSDIQAITIREKQGAGVLFDTVLVIALLLMAGSALVVFWLAIPVAIGAAAFAVHKWRGQRCFFSVTTATGDWTIRSVARLRLAREALATIRPRIEAIQGVIDIGGMLEQGARPGWPIPPPPRDSRAARGWHIVLFSMVLVACAVSLVQMAYPRTGMTALLPWLAEIPVVLLLAIVLIRDRGGESVDHHAAVVIMLLKAGEYTIAIAERIWTGSLVARTRSLPMVASQFFNNWNLIYGGFEVLLAVTAIVALIERRGGRA